MTKSPPDRLDEIRGILASDTEILHHDDVQFLFDALDAMGAVLDAAREVAAEMGRPGFGDAVKVMCHALDSMEKWDEGIAP